MKLSCSKCDKDVDIIIKPSGPHLKAVCSICKGYIKFLNTEEKKRSEDDEENILNG